MTTRPSRVYARPARCEAKIDLSLELVKLANLYYTSCQNP